MHSLPPQTKSQRRATAVNGDTESRTTALVDLNRIVETSTTPSECSLEPFRVETPPGAHGRFSSRGMSLPFFANLMRRWSGPANVQSRPKGMRKSVWEGMVSEGKSAMNVYVRRQHLMRVRRVYNDFAFGFAMVGIVLMVVVHSVSFRAHFHTRVDLTTNILRSFLVATTVCLLFFIAAYHYTNLKLFMLKSGIEDWRIVLTPQRALKVMLEMVVCACCPLPFTSHAWDFLLSFPMFFRFLLLGRFLLLRSRLFNDTKARSVAAINKLKYDYRFIAKSAMRANPGTCLIVYATLYCIISAYVMLLCERYEPYVEILFRPNSSHELERRWLMNSTSVVYYRDALWTVYVTFLTIGYGDIVPSTFCGKTVSIITGAMGIGILSFVVAVIARKLQLNACEERVHEFVLNSRLRKQLHESASNVMKQAWRTYKLSKSESEKSTTLPLRCHKQKLLLATMRFREVRRLLAAPDGSSCCTPTDDGKLGNNTVAMIKAMNERMLDMQDALKKTLAAYEKLSRKLDCLNEITGV